MALDSCWLKCGRLGEKTRKRREKDEISIFDTEAKEDFRPEISKGIWKGIGNKVEINWRKAIEEIV
jgi:hypothetical protein